VNKVNNVPDLSLDLGNSHFWNIAQDTTAINCFNHRNRTWIVNFLNDTCHLNEGGGGGEGEGGFLRAL
jgi:hypothetical protein